MRRNPAASALPPARWSAACWGIRWAAAMAALWPPWRARSAAVMPAMKSNGARAPRRPMKSGSGWRTARCAPPPVQPERLAGGRAGSRGEWCADRARLSAVGAAQLLQVCAACAVRGRGACKFKAAFRRRFSILSTYSCIHFFTPVLLLQLFSGLFLALDLTCRSRLPFGRNPAEFFLVPAGANLPAPSNDAGFPACTGTTSKPNRSQLWRAT